ncbi:MAG: hypothetical protein J6Y02_11875 [Pseudobutyrivibrio sp.]|nr:hypothetical protein [Pseudobutyrivibrio sp.]
MGIMLTVLGAVLSAAGFVVDRIAKRRDAEAAAEKVWQKHNKTDEVTNDDTKGES